MDIPTDEEFNLSDATELLSSSEPDYGALYDADEIYREVCDKEFWDNYGDKENDLNEKVIENVVEIGTSKVRATIKIKVLKFKTDWTTGGGGETNLYETQILEIKVHFKGAVVQTQCERLNFTQVMLKILKISIFF